MVEQYSILENVINILWLNYVKSRHIGLTFGSNSHWEFQIWVPGSQKFFIVQLVELFTNWKKKKALECTRCFRGLPAYRYKQKAKSGSVFIMAYSF